MNNYRLLVISSCFGLLTALFVFFLISTEKGRLGNALEYRKGVEIERGAVLYSLHCSSCHGSRGEGIGQLGPALSDEHFFRSRLQEVGWQSTLSDYILATSEHGRLMGTRPIYAGDGKSAVMPSWHQRYGGPLRTDEIDLLVRFILNWEKTAIGKVQLQEIELPKTNTNDLRVIATGKSVFKSNCSSCHQFKELGDGSRIGPDLSDIVSLSAARKSDMKCIEYIKESVLIPEAFVVSGFEKVVAESPCRSVISRRELESVIAFLMH